MVTLCDSRIAKVDSAQNLPFFHFFVWESLDHMCFHPIFPECVAKGSRLTLGGLGVEPCS